MKKCYFLVVATLIAFSPLAFSMKHINEDPHFEDDVAAAAYNEGDFRSDFFYVVNRCGEVIEKTPAFVVNGCVNAIDNVVGTPSDVLNGCCVLLNGAQNIVNGCVNIIDNTVGTPSEVLNWCSRNPGLVMIGVTTLLVEGTDGARLGGDEEVTRNRNTFCSTNCSACYCTCMCVGDGGRSIVTLGPADNVLQCGQACPTRGTGFKIYQCQVTKNT